MIVGFVVQQTRPIGAVTHHELELRVANGGGEHGAERNSEAELPAIP